MANADAHQQCTCTTHYTRTDMSTDSQRISGLKDGDEIRDVRSRGHCGTWQLTALTACPLTVTSVVSPTSHTTTCYTARIVDPAATCYGRMLPRTAIICNRLLLSPFDDVSRRPNLPACACVPPTCRVAVQIVMRSVVSGCSLVWLQDNPTATTFAARVCTLTG